MALYAIAVGAFGEEEHVFIVPAVVGSGAGFVVVGVCEGEGCEEGEEEGG